jgi:hypothetical protein
MPISLIAKPLAMGADAIVAQRARAWIDLNRAEEDLEPALRRRPAADRRQRAGAIGARAHAEPTRPARFVAARFPSPPTRRRGCAMCIAPITGHYAHALGDAHDPLRLSRC